MLIMKVLYLSAPINYLNKKNLWTGTHFDYGLIGNNINIFFYYLFGEITIGINRFGSLCLILLNKILVILLCKKLIINTLEFRNKNLIFFVFCFASLGLADFNEHVNPIHARMFVFLIFFLFLIEVLIFENTKLISFILGLFSPTAAIFYFDIGAYINAIIIISLIFLIYTKKYINIAYIFLD